MDENQNKSRDDLFEEFATALTRWQQKTQELEDASLEDGSGEVGWFSRAYASQILERATLRKEAMAALDAYIRSLADEPNTKNIPL